MSDLSIRLPITTLAGQVRLLKTGVFAVRHKKPRSSKFLETHVHPDAVICAVTAKEGYIVFRATNEEFQSRVSKIAADTTTGLLTAVTEEGDTIYADPQAAIITHQLED